MRRRNREARSTEGTSASCRRPAVLSELLDGRLNSYALAAGAAGVALLACSTPAAEAAPVCNTLSVQLFRSVTYPFNPAGQTLAPFNLGQSTVVLSSSGSNSSSVNWNRAFFAPNSIGANLLVDSQGLPANVASGAAIGPGGNFGKGVSYALMFTYGKGPAHVSGTLSKHQGNFNFQQENLFGFQFAQAGSIHFGWARMKASIQLYQRSYKRTRITLLGYGYESSPNTAIDAGSCTNGSNSKQSAQTAPNDASSAKAEATLGMLAFGSDSLSLWRK
jgi:hypothetical protein